MRLIYSLLLAFTFAAVGHAKPITFILESDWYTSALVGEQPYSYGRVTITAKADTKNRISLGEGLGWRLEHDSAQVEIWGMQGAANFLTKTYSLIGQSFFMGEGRYSMGTSEEPFGVISDGPTGVPFKNWDMATSFGPHLGATAFFWGSPLTSIMTDRGYFSCGGGGWTGATLTAIVTPEPSSICLCIGSIVLLGIWRRVAYVDRPVRRLSPFLRSGAWVYLS